jgi:PBP1b-binding outer membrane lipoprotein LpoB
MIAIDSLIGGDLGVFSMKKIVTFAAVAVGALALTACGSKTEEAPAEPAETEMMAPAEAPVDPAAAAAEGVDPTSNPIRPAQSVDSAEMAPVAE